MRKKVGDPHQKMLQARCTAKILNTVAFSNGEEKISRIFCFQMSLGEDVVFSSCQCSSLVLAFTSTRPPRMENLGNCR